MNNCILWGNSDTSGTTETAQLYVAGGSAAVNFSCIHGFTSLGGIGNTGLSPLFVSLTDFNVQSGSPCVDAGNNSVDIDWAVPGTQPIPAIDLVGHTRITDGDCDDSFVVDMGCLESPGCP